MYVNTLVLQRKGVATGLRQTAAEGWDRLAKMAATPRGAQPFYLTPQRTPAPASPQGFRSMLTTPQTASSTSAAKGGPRMHLFSPELSAVSSPVQSDITNIFGTPQREAVEAVEEASESFFDKAAAFFRGTPARRPAHAAHSSARLAGLL